LSYIFHSPDKLSLILRNLEPSHFPDEFHRKLFETLILRLNKRQSIELSSLGGEFSASQMGRIERIKADSTAENAVAFTDERLNGYIKILTEFKKNNSRKAPEDMSNEELLEYTKELLLQKNAPVFSEVAGSLI
jgi:replicative DNA helicase